MAAKPYTTKQFGDACELLVAAELTFAGIPTMKAPDYWPGYDLVAQPPGTLPQRISVKGRTFSKGSAFVDYRKYDVFDWLAIVIVPREGAGERGIYLVPRDVSDACARTYKGKGVVDVAEFRIDEVADLFDSYRNNFALSRPEPSAARRR
ncbi:hypothetical protein [Amorphus orientalis]|uniref:Uncharacterized protein n=1 Tax=Amorphus orientalis TaxID=649198 RepID=A0AAE3VL14_9HYPH|nr:hypothetical protein [Amorphus orientalis]MDQ0313656.1 hypothetical protein [Amorphus orientalis]